MDEAGHVLDVQVEGVMRASVARLGYEWTRTRRRQLVEALVHLSRELHACPRHGRSVTYDFFTFFTFFTFSLFFTLFTLFSFSQFFSHFVHFFCEIFHFFIYLF